ncbi:MAG: hypothetical protein Q7T25_04335 [Sideroxyarcus sp.]|nr:hypothetical protein [Sideroxyarcus sp.]
MKLCSTEIPEHDRLDLFDLLHTQGFDATLTLLCTFFMFSVD